MRWAGGAGTRPQEHKKEKAASQEAGHLLLQTTRMPLHQGTLGLGGSIADALRAEGPAMHLGAATPRPLAEHGVPPGVAHMDVATLMPSLARAPNRNRDVATDL